jgi:hypothetical protein
MTRNITKKYQIKNQENQIKKADYFNKLPTHMNAY